MWKSILLSINVVLASGPYRAACEIDECSARSSLSDLEKCYEKAGKKPDGEKSEPPADICSKERDSHEAALAKLKACLTEPVQPQKKAKP